MSTMGVNDYAVFERRFADIAILDHAALIERIAHAVANPVEANLVRTHREWTGLCFFAGAIAKKHRFTILHEGRYQRALRDRALVESSGGAEATIVRRED